MSTDRANAPIISAQARTRPRGPSVGTPNDDTRPYGYNTQKSSASKTMSKGTKTDEVDQAHHRYDSIYIHDLLKDLPCTTYSPATKK